MTALVQLQSHHSPCNETSPFTSQTDGKDGANLFYEHLIHALYTSSRVKYYICKATVESVWNHVYLVCSPEGVIAVIQGSCFTKRKSSESAYMLI